ncbi:MAG: hypothetical protein WAL05_22345 [Candidatus Sulfotelmatobacter sp.]
MKFLRLFQLVVLITCSILLTQGKLSAQDEQSALPSIRLEVRSADQVAASSTSDYRVHMRLKIASMNRYSPFPIKAAVPGPSTVRPDDSASAPVSDATIPAVPPPGFYPADLSHLYGGPVVTTAESNPVYVDCTSSCWGNPAAFLRNLGKATSST